MNVPTTSFKYKHTPETASRRVTTAFTLTCKGHSLRPHRHTCQRRISRARLRAAAGGGRRGQHRGRSPHTAGSRPTSAWHPQATEQRSRTVRAAGLGEPTQQKELHGSHRAGAPRRRPTVPTQGQDDARSGEAGEEAAGTPGSRHNPRSSDVGHVPAHGLAARPAGHRPAAPPRTHLFTCLKLKRLNLSKLGSFKEEC